jgi:uncharacterized membrane protein
MSVVCVKAVPGGDTLPPEEELMLREFANSALQGLMAVPRDARFSRQENIAAQAWTQVWEMLVWHRKMRSGVWPD